MQWSVAVFRAPRRWVPMVLHRNVLLTDIDSNGILFGMCQVVWFRLKLEPGSEKGWCDEQDFGPFEGNCRAQWIRTKNMCKCYPFMSSGSQLARSRLYDQMQFPSSTARSGPSFSAAIRPWNQHRGIYGEEWKQRWRRVTRRIT